MKLEHSLTPYTKIKSKWIKDLNVRSETVKLFQENLGSTLFDINCSKILFDPPPKVMEIKKKNSKWGLIKLKSFCTAKKTVSKMKRQPSEWEKIITDEATDKGLISKIYKPDQQQKNKQPNQKMGRKPKQTFLQRRHTYGQQTHEKMLNITHYQRNANQNCYEVVTPTGQNDHIKILQTINAGEDVVKREAPCTVGGNVN